MKNNKQNYIIFADVLSDEVRYLCRRADGSLYTCTVAADANGFYEKDASDISEMTILMADAAYETGDPINLDLIKAMAKETTNMVIKSVDAFVQKDMDMAHWVIKEDDVVDDLFNQFKQQLIKKINENVKNGEQATDMLMVAKYFERIGDHATNIAEWVIYSITGQHEN